METNGENSLFKDKIAHNSTTLRRIFKKLNIYEILREYCTRLWYVSKKICLESLLLSGESALSIVTCWRDTQHKHCIYCRDSLKVEQMVLVLLLIAILEFHKFT